MKKLILTLILVFALTGCSTSTVDTIDNDANFEHSDFYTSQLEQKEKYLDEFQSSDATLESPEIIVNPWDVNELSAYVAFKSDDKVSYEYTVKGKSENTDYVFSTDELSTDVIIPVIGLYYGENTVEITTKDANGEEVGSTSLSIDTSDQEIPKSYLTTDVEKTSDKVEELLGNKIIFSATYNGYDMDGNLRFYTPTSRTQYFHYNDNSVYSVGDGKDPKYIYKSDAMGVIKTEYLMPDGLEAHHDFTNSTDGTFYALATPDSEVEGGMQADGDSAIVETQIVTFDDQTGKMKETFDMYDMFDENPVVASGVEFDPMHVNAITYDEATDSIIMSSQAQGMLFALDAKSFEINWIIDEPGDVQESADKVLNPIGDMVYTSGQHSVYVNENPKYDDYRGDNKFVISAFNNNVCKNADGEEYKTDQVDGPFKKWDICAYADDGNHEYDESTVVTYAIDLTNFTVETIDNFALPHYSPIVSYVNTFETDNNYYSVFEGSSNVPTYLILDADGNIVYEMGIPKSDERAHDYRGTAVSIDKLATTFQVA